MGVTDGPTGQLRGWMSAAAAAAAAAAVGMLVVLLLPRHLSAADCNDRDNATMACPLDELTGVSCSYVKGTPPPRSVSPIVPGPVEQLEANPYLVYGGGVCQAYLNITWKINPQASCRDLTGFLLNVSFVYKNSSKYIYRIYSLSVADWNNTDIFKTTFRHECIIPVANSLYRIEVHSLPLSPVSSRGNFNVTNYIQNADFSGMASCDRPKDPDMTHNWTATMWNRPVLLADNFTSLEVCFFFAPLEFRFQRYRMLLMNINTSVMGETLQEAMIYDNGTQPRQACHKFEKVCPGVYEVRVMPMNEIGQCTCRAGPYPSDCTEYCQYTVLQPIDMTTSVCTTTSSTPPPPQPPVPWSEGTTEDNKLSGDKIAGIVVGVTLAAVMIIAAVVIFCIHRCRRYEDINGKLEEISDCTQTSTLPTRLPVLLVYSTDNESHRKVIRSFAAFLHACCGCEVLYDEWSQVAIAQTNPIDWLSKQMYRVKHVIIVNSLGAYEQYRGWIEQKLYVPESNLLLPDMFIPAIRQLQNKFYQGSPKFHCFHVCFPYTDQKHILDLSCGRCYKLMDHIEDLVLNIHGLSKFSAKGTTCVEQVNSTTYHLNAKEGISLRKAIEEASDCAREQPNWFQRYYRLVDNRVIGESMDGGVQNTDSLSLDEQEAAARDESGSSSIGTASDMEYIPPSPDGSYTAAAAAEMMHSVSPDVGIAEMNYSAGEGSDATITTTAATTSSHVPPMFMEFTPLPPDDFDDASSIGSRSFVAKINELNEQFDSGIPGSIQDLEGFNGSFC